MLLQDGIGEAAANGAGDPAGAQREAGRGLQLGPDAYQDLLRGTVNGTKPNGAPVNGALSGVKINGAKVGVYSFWGARLSSRAATRLQ